MKHAVSFLGIHKSDFQNSVGACINFQVFKDGSSYSRTDRSLDHFQLPPLDSLNESSSANLSKPLCNHTSPSIARDEILKQAV
jgi:hypothetical protein